MTLDRLSAPASPPSPATSKHSRPFSIFDDASYYDNEGLMLQLLDVAPGLVKERLHE